MIKRLRNSSLSMSNIAWNDIEKLMMAFGSKIKEGKGSGSVFVLNKKVFPFHRLHPQKEAKPYQVDELRKFLFNMEIVP